MVTLEAVNDTGHFSEQNCDVGMTLGEEHSKASGLLGNANSTVAFSKLTLNWTRWL
jgi:hypothetical protein